jgi:hypothetical protein
MGFSVADEQIFKVICFYLQMKLERAYSFNEANTREKGVISTLKLCSNICTQRNHEGLFRKLRENLPLFFGFEAVGVLFYDFDKE